MVKQWLNAPQIIHQAAWAYQPPADIYTEVNIKRFFDGIIFIDKTTPTRPTVNALESVTRRERY